MTALEIKAEFEKAGCVQDSEDLGIWRHKDFPFEMMERKGKLILMSSRYYEFDNDKIPLKAENIINLVKAFNP
jgi:hypothetical protein